MEIASVIISEASLAFDKKYTYLIPEKYKDVICKGLRVIVPFGAGNISKEGFVLAVSGRSECSMKLKEIKKIQEPYPVICEELVELIEWMRERYLCTYHDVIRCMIPPGSSLKRIITIVFIHEKENATKGQRIVLDILKQNGIMELEELKQKADIKGFSNVIKALEKAGSIEIKEKYSQKAKGKFMQAVYLNFTAEEVEEDIRSNKIKKIQHIKVLEALMEHEHLQVTEIINEFGITRGMLDTLIKNGYISVKNIEVQRNPFECKEVEVTNALKLNHEQELVIEKMKNQVELNKFTEILLHGVTGSGKTEVYMQLIDFIIKKSERTALVLVPEISLTPQMVERFRGRFGKNVAVLHSRLGMGERYDQWNMIKKGEIKVVIGARSAVFAPLKSIGIIIIDEEHETSYKSESMPKYHAVEVARKRCEIDNALLLLGSATPSIDAYFKAQKSEITLLEIKNRANKIQMPETRIINMRTELENGNRSIFSKSLREEMLKNKQNKKQTIIFINRRGFASFVLCRNCGLKLKCTSCNVTMTYHSSDDRLICHYCGYTEKSPQICPKCGSNYIRKFGIGTQKVVEEIKRNFRDFSVIRMDADTTTHKNAHEKILRKFKEQNIDILVGTQMVAKGHDFENVTLVGVIAADSILDIGDYRAPERTFQLLTQVSGRAGRGNERGRAIIQTYNVDDYSIISACEHDYKAFYEKEIILRDKLEYPPFSNIAIVTLSGRDDKKTFIATKGVSKFVIDNNFEGNNEYAVMGPVRSPITKLKDRYRWRIVIKSIYFNKVVFLLSELGKWFYTSNKKTDIRINMDINPYSML